MKNKVTIYTIAQELGMSPSMVSRALSPNGKVDEEKRKLIIKTAEKYNFTPNRFASRLSGRHIRIGILLYNRFKPIADKMLDGIETAYNEYRDYKIEYKIKIIKSIDKKPWECENELFAFSDFDGVIISGFGSDKCTDMLKRFVQINPNLVQLQSINEQADCLFVSRHNEKTASNLAAEFLYNCLKRGNKNVLLFTGWKINPLHRRAEQAFKNACEEYGLNFIDCIDMQDNDKVLEDLLPSVFEKYKNIDGIYITSGNSIPLCKYIKENKLDVALVTFDTYKELTEYIADGTVSMTISQNIKMQTQNAFKQLADYLINGKVPEKISVTDVRPIMRSIL